MATALISHHPVGRNRWPAMATNRPSTAHAGVATELPRAGGERAGPGQGDQFDHVGRVGTGEGYDLEIGPERGDLDRQSSQCLAGHLHTCAVVLDAPAVGGFPVWPVRMTTWPGPISCTMASQ